MANPKTPNIGLNKIDRSSPATTYFDLEKYIDQNADAIDQFAGKVNAAIDDTSQRLDTEKHQEVVLQPGMQILNAERSAPFSLSGIKGRTLVNLLGRDGDFEYLSSDLYYSNTSAIIDNTAMCTGSSSIKATATGIGTTEHYIDIVGDYRVKRGSYYVAVGMVKPIKGAAQIRIYNQSHPAPDPNFFMTMSNIITEKGAFSLVIAKFRPLEDCGVYARLYLLNDPKTDLYVQNGESSNFDSLRIYEITAEEYAALDSMTPEQISAEYPYVDSVQPVRNPYAIRCGENLLPPFYEAKYITTASKATIVEPYELKIAAGGNGDFTALHILVVPNQTYTFSFENYGISWGVTGLDYNTAIVPYNNDKSRSFNVGDRTGVALVFKSFSTGIDVSCKNPMLTIGSEPKPFKPREDSMLALQTDLYADPVTGENADEVFERDGQYFKLAKWRMVILGNAQPWELPVQNYSGYKAVGTNGILGGLTDSQKVVKYDGSILKNKPFGFPFDAGDQSFYSNSNGTLYVSIKNTDSGWGDNYTPTPEDIKAYFLGWKMYDSTGATSTVYNRTDGAHKAWVNLVKYLKGDSSWPPYQLVYQLATPTVEPIVSEGMLTFNEGDNQVEVGTGIVVRERAKPTHYSLNGNYYINNKELSGSQLKNKVSLMLRVYRNGQVDNTAKIENDSNAYGKQHVRFLPSDFDQTAAYSVTYLMSDKSPVVPFVGSYAANEKVMLQELTDAVQQNATATSAIVSTLESIAGGAEAAKEAETNAKKYVDSKPWQKAILTRDDWKNIDLPPGFDLNTLVKNGFYNGVKLKNAPTLEGEDRWLYIEVQCHTNGDDYVLQRASKLNSGVNAFYQRTKENGVWYPWSQDLFTSVANGKQAIASAISGKGVPASGSDEFAVLANKIGQISTGIKTVEGTLGGDWYGSITNLPITPKIVLIYAFIDEANVRLSGYVSAYLNGSNVIYNASTSGATGSSGTGLELYNTTFGSNHVNFSLTRSNARATRYIIYGV